MIVFYFSGVTPEDLSDAPHISEVIPKVKKILEKVKKKVYWFSFMIPSRILSALIEEI